MSQSKEELVYQIFSSIASRYDLLNTILSFNRDKFWRRFAVKEMSLFPGSRALDVCCGTAMLSREIARVVGPEGNVTGVDFCEAMLDRARENIQKWGIGGMMTLKKGNAMELPFAGGEFDGAVIGFALRNVPDIKKVVAEMKRVVRPGGKVVSLELAKPGAPFFKQLYYFYFDYLVPLLGKAGSRTQGPYAYLPQSLKKFPHQKEVGALFESEGLKDVHYHELTGGIVAVHVGTVA